MFEGTPGCDLLSDLFFAIFNNNGNLGWVEVNRVVICFQICSLLYLTTIISTNTTSASLL